ncbi:tRNA adenosine(34) deaminase TadA [Demequina muriae]|uniref:tRNA-specific adenosine deaminase n=1 Tax=Demequina muriae TaxID=3051664 RepID=A0ABT8GGZ7_9MICO|nr:tRNA adenosine(34) deaminase TadA [Demequina sp. EGI L300058]MDN4480708.1 tRNA adenosine(34) deaminase TadA [Demequina sp. EGI L300058]
MSDRDRAGWDRTDWSGAMGEALALAERASAAGDVPVGAVVLDATGAVIGRGFNHREVAHDPTAHAEVLALREAAAARGTWRLDDCTLVVTLEPCVMCAGALLAARIPRLVIGAWDAKAGATGSQWDLVRDARIGAKVEVVSGVRAAESSSLLSAFFEARR